MILNINNKTDTYFDGIDAGECFAYNGNYYMLARGNDGISFGVNLSDGSYNYFDDDCRVLRLTAEITFKELS